VARDEHNADYTLCDQLAYLRRIRKVTERELHGFIAGKQIPPEFAQHARRPEMPARYFTSVPNEFRILDYVQVRRQVGRNFVARCPSCAGAGRDQSGDNLAISVSEPGSTSAGPAAPRR